MGTTVGLTTHEIQPAFASAIAAVTSMSSRGL